MKQKTEAHPRDKILIAAKKEFSERGFIGARMSSIAKRAAVNKALIHYYFTDKDTLYLEVLNRSFRGVGEGRIPVYAGNWELTPSQKLHVIIYFLVNIFLKATDEDAMRIIFWELAEGKRFLDTLLEEHWIPRNRIIKEIIREGIEIGEFDTISVDLAAPITISFLSFLTINREIYGDKSLFRDLYGDIDENLVYQFMLETVFKALMPQGEKLEIPEIPEDLKSLVDELMTFLVEKKNEFVNEEVFKIVEEILHQENQ